MATFGDVHDEPVTFLASRTAGMALVVTALTAVGFGDPLLIALTYGLAVGGAFAGAAFLLRRQLDRVED
jgi:hypothetical protein